MLYFYIGVDYKMPSRVMSHLVLLRILGSVSNAGLECHPLPPASLPPCGKIPDPSPPRLDGAAYGLVFLVLRQIYGPQKVI